MRFFGYVTNFEKQSTISHLKMFHIHNFYGFGSKKTSFKIFSKRKFILIENFDILSPNLILKIPSKTGTDQYKFLHFQVSIFIQYG